MMTAPAFFNRSTTVESRVAAGVPTSTFDPPSVVTPASSNRSLIEIGMPASADSFAPPCRWASARSATERLRSSQVDDEIELGRLLYREVARLCNRVEFYRHKAILVGRLLWRR